MRSHRKSDKKRSRRVKRATDLAMQGDPSILVNGGKDRAMVNEDGSITHDATLPEYEIDRENGGLRRDEHGNPVVIGRRTFPDWVKRG